MQSEVVKGPLVEPESSMLKSITFEPLVLEYAIFELSILDASACKVPVLVNLGSGFESQVQESQQVVQLSSEVEFLIPRSSIQQIPISAESSLLVHSHMEQAIPVSHLMDLDDSRGSFDLAIIKEKVAEVS